MKTPKTQPDSALSPSQVFLAQPNIEHSRHSSFAIIKKQLKEYANLVSGMTTGVTSAVVFHIFDRAFYLAMTNDRPLLAPENFKNLRQGMGQSILFRSISGGVYFVFQGRMNQSVYPFAKETLKLGNTSAQALVGFFAGLMTGISTNFLSTIKYQTWSANQKQSLGETVGNMIKGGGYGPFTKGMYPLIYREVAFGITYEPVRTLLKSKLDVDSTFGRQMNFVCNGISASIAIVVSCPFHYIRNMQYKTPPDQAAPSMSAVWNGLMKDMKNHSPSLAGRAMFFQSKMMLGPAVLRNAIGMAVGQGIFDGIKKRLG